MSEQLITNVTGPNESNEAEVAQNVSSETVAQPQSKRSLRKKAVLKFGDSFEIESDSEFEGPASKHRSRYHSVSNEKRLKLIKLVIEQGKKIKPAARKLGINYSTAKSICQIYRREGRTTKKDIVRVTTKKENEQSEVTSTTAASEGTHSEGTSEPQRRPKKKSKLEKPCHGDLEPMTLRKKVKILQAERETQLQKQNELKPEKLTTEIRCKVELEAPLSQQTFPVENKETGKVFAEPAIPVINPELQKAILQPLLRNLQTTMPTPNPLLQFQLQQAQKAFLPLNTAQSLPNLAHVMSQQTSRQVAQQMLPFPLQAQLGLQNNLMRVQELHMLNKLLATANAAGRMPALSTINNPIIPKNSFFF